MIISVTDPTQQVILDQDPTCQIITDPDLDLVIRR
jgi:hypothetical protein